MESKQLWTTVIIAAVAALVVSLIVVNLSGVSLSPRFGQRVAVQPVPVDDVEEPVGGTNKADLVFDLSYRPSVAVSCGGGGNSTGGNSTNVTCSFIIQETVKNIGSAPTRTSNGTFTGFYTEISVFGPGYSETRHVWNGPLAVGESAIVSAMFTEVSLGSYIALEHVDNFNMVLESNENNNFANRTFSV